MCLTHIGLFLPKMTSFLKVSKQCWKFLVASRTFLLIISCCFSSTWFLRYSCQDISTVSSPILTLTVTFSLPDWSTLYFTWQFSFSNSGVKLELQRMSPEVSVKKIWK